MPCPCKSIHGCAHFHTPSPIYRTIHSSGARCLCAQAPSRAFAGLQSAAAALAFPPAARFAESRPYAADFPAVAIPLYTSPRSESRLLPRNGPAAGRSATVGFMRHPVVCPCARRGKPREAETSVYIFYSMRRQARKAAGRTAPRNRARFFARRPVHGRQPRRHGAAHGGQRGGDLGGVLRQGAHGHPAQRYLRHLRDAHEDRRLGEVQREQEQSPAPAAIWPAAMLPANRKGTARKRPGRAATGQGVTGIATISVTISEGYRRFVTVLEGYGERHTPFTTCINRKKLKL